MTEREQRYILEHVRAMIRQTWLRHCLTVKITRKRATYDRPAEWRMWIYVKGLPITLDDGCSNGHLFRATDYDERKTSIYLLRLAMTSPWANDYIVAQKADSNGEQ